MAARNTRRLPPLWVVLTAGVSSVLLSAQAGKGRSLADATQAVVAAHHGQIAFYAAQLDSTGAPVASRTLTLDADREVQTASDIKLAILYHAMVEIRAGRARWEEPVILRPGEPVGGSGVLHFLDTPLRLTLKDVLSLMVILSDNTAANLAIDRFGVDPVNARLQALGLMHTHLYKKVMKPATGPMPADQPKFGLGKTTPREMAALMTAIASCRLRQAAGSPQDQVQGGVHARRGQPGGGSAAALLPMDAADKAVCEVAFPMLANQFYRETIPRLLPGGGEGAVLSKTGSLDAVRNDVAVVSGKSGPVVLAIFTYGNTDTSWTVDNEAEMSIAKLSKAIVDAWPPAGLSPKALVPGLVAAESGSAR